MTIIRSSHRTGNIRSYAVKSDYLLDCLPASRPASSHPFRPATRFGGAWDGADTACRPTGWGAGRRAGRVGRNVKRGEEQKSHDVFIEQVDTLLLAVAITVVPLYHHGAAGSRAVFPFPFPPFWSWLLTVNPPPPLRFERWRSLLPIPECSGRHCHDCVFCRSG